MIFRKLFFIVIICLSSCSKEDSDGIPAFIKINSIVLNDNATDNITDAWVYINDNLQGVYELPITFPVLEEGYHNIRIKAGIKENGIAATRIRYPFYSSYIIDNLRLQKDSITIIDPEVNYLDNLTYFQEDFEGIGLNIESTNVSDTSVVIINEQDLNYGAGILHDSLLTFEIATTELTDLPQANSAVFLELDYKCNTEFLIGVYINYPIVVQRELLWITPKDDWNKIYVNLTSTITESVNAPSFSVFLGMKRNFELDTNIINFDNLRVIY